MLTLVLGLQVFQGFQLVNVWTLQPPGGAPGLPGGGSGVRKLPIRKGLGVPYPWLPDEKRQVSPREGVFSFRCLARGPRSREVVVLTSSQAAAPGNLGADFQGHPAPPPHAPSVPL